MSTMKSRWRRIACGVILALFTASVFAGTLCTGHSVPHSAHVHGWMTVGAHTADVGGLATPSEHDESGGSCDPPVYASATPTSDTEKQIGGPTHLQVDAVASNVVAHEWVASPAVYSPRPPPPYVTGVQGLVSVSARLRI